MEAFCLPFAFVGYWVLLQCSPASVLTQKPSAILLLFMKVFSGAALPWPKPGLYNLIFPVCEQTNCIMLDLPLRLLSD